MVLSSPPSTKVTPFFLRFFKFFVRSGEFHDGEITMIAYHGRWWSKTTPSETYYAYNFYLGDLDNIAFSDKYYRYVARPLRCLAI